MSAQRADDQPRAAPVAVSTTPSSGRSALAAGAALSASGQQGESAPLFIATRPCSLEVVGFGTSIETARVDAVHAVLARNGKECRQPDIEAAKQMVADLLVFRLVDGQP